MTVRDLGRTAYRPCAELQADLLERVASGEDDDTLLLVEHDPVVTLGAAFYAQNLLLSEGELRNRGIEVELTDRGGDITYHGPGQLVAYPIFNLKRHGSDLHKWLRSLEQTVVLCLSRFGIEANPEPVTPIGDHKWTGVWVGDRKICAIGIKVRRWTSMHGLALNCDNDLTPFSYIVPCGIRELAVTSMTQELGRDVPVSEVKPALIDTFAEAASRACRTIEA